MAREMRPTGIVRESDSGGTDVRAARAAVWHLLPSERAVSRWTARLLYVGVACLVIGLPALARLASRGAGTAVRSGLLAVGYTCLVLAAAVPAAYWAAVLCVGVGTMLRRRWLPAWRCIRSVVVERGHDLEGHLRL
jgi:hypothetical protein